MRSKTYLGAATAITGAGTAFSGYLTLVHMTEGVCAFNEPCPLFLGHPACYTGFVLFGLSLAVSVCALQRRSEALFPLVVNLALGITGGVFAGSMMVGASGGGAHFALGLPTCAYGLFFFLVLAAVSAYAWMSRPTRPNERRPSLSGSTA